MASRLRNWLAKLDSRGGNSLTVRLCNHRILEHRVHWLSSWCAIKRDLFVVCVSQCGSSIDIWPVTRLNL